MIALTSTLPVVPFHCLNAREIGVIRHLDGDQPTVARFQEMGIRPGVLLQMIRPGNPHLVCVDGKRFSIRCDDLLDILVEPNILEKPKAAI